MPVLRNGQSRFAENLIKNLNAAPIKECSSSYEDKVSSHTAAGIYNEMALGKKRNANLREFAKSAKVAFLGECLNKIYTGALSRIMTEGELPVDPKQVIASYIQEKGVDKILGDIQYQSIMLSEFYQMVNKYADMVMEDCKEHDDCSEFKIPEEIRDKFYDELDMEDTDDVVFQISDRVNDAIDEFVNTNTLNKLNIKDILTTAAEKMESTKSDVQKESAERVARRAIHDVKNTGRIGILCAMVEATARKIMETQSLRESYMEGTKLDMTRIVNTCKMSYTLMEMTNYIKMEEMNEESILEFIKGI